MHNPFLPHVISLQKVEIKKIRYVIIRMILNFVQATFGLTVRRLYNGKCENNAFCLRKDEERQSLLYTLPGLPGRVRRIICDSCRESRYTGIRKRFSKD